MAAAAVASGSPEGLRYDRQCTAANRRRSAAPRTFSAADFGLPNAGRRQTLAVETIGMADAQYDAAVVDLEKALKAGRGRLDSSTIAIVEHNLQIIDQAINQAREALVGDPAEHLLEQSSGRSPPPQAGSSAARHGADHRHELEE